MFISDISVKRPVLATVMSLLLTVLGVVAFANLPLRELPNVDSPVVSVNTAYRGADAAVVESRVTKPLEDAISGIEGIRTVTSSSQTGQSQISIEFSLAREIEGAANDVRDAVSRVLGRLPREADPPQVFKVDTSGDAILWLNLASTRLNQRELTDYAQRFLVDRLSAVDGVASVIIGGEQRYAMRIWVEREALAARGLTIGDLEDALTRENVELPAGAINSTTRDFTVRVQRGYVKPEDFASLSIAKGRDGHLVRIGEVARVELGSIEWRNEYRGNGQPQLGMGVVKTSTANELQVAADVKAAIARIQGSLPADTRLLVAFDSTIFVDTALHEVYKTLGAAIVLVLVVIYLFLGSARAALIPAVTVPVCAVTAFAALYAFGFSINLLTLLALVLAIGLVVDDAIVVLENCQRRVDLGESRLVAAYRGARQVGFAVIATTVVLVAVFLPIAFMGGFSGRLFRELAVAIAAAVAISGVVALSLTPMMCSKLLVPHAHERGLARRMDVLFRRAQGLYSDGLERVLARPRSMVPVMLVAIGLSVLLFRVLPAELAPLEDRGMVDVTVTGPDGAGFEWTSAKMREVEKPLLKLVEEGEAARVNVRMPTGRGSSVTQTFNTGRAIVLLAPYGERSLSSQEVLERLRRETRDITGVRVLPGLRQGLSRNSGQPLQFVLQGSNYDELADWRNRLMRLLERNPNLYALDSDYKETQPQLRVEIDHTRAADLGVSTAEIGHTLETYFGGRRTTTFTMDGEEYDVIVQAGERERGTSNDLANLYVRSMSTRQLIPLGNLVKLSDLGAPASLNRFNRLRSITITAGISPGSTLGEALAFVEQSAKEALPPQTQTDTKGDSRDLKETGSAVAFTFGMALLVVFLVLSAQFESFMHPFVIMLTVPLAVLGALLGLLLLGSSLNLYSQIGIIMLVGLAAKNGILIVEFANQLRDQGRDVLEAIRESAAVRLRPIVMTSIATVVGALPLLFATGAGSASRRTIGTVVVFGVLLSTFLSLFVVPAMYRLFAGYTQSPHAVARRLADQERAQPATEEALP